MFHHIYTTDGIIINSYPYKEGDKFFFIFTKDLGLISATASGIRYVKSKLRYHIQEYSLVNLSLVKGKEVWRITGAREKEDTQRIIHNNKILFTKILSILKRLVHGEEKNEELFFILEKSYEYLSREILDETRYLNLESLVILRILNNLGYIKEEAGFKGLLDNNDIDKTILNECLLNRKDIVKQINKALKESQL